MNKYELLLKQWCDKLIELQITEIKDPLFYGGILCPACAMIHGRVADAVYPLTLMYDLTKDTKYLNAAKIVVDWSEYNLKRNDGSIYNDKCSGWKGITVFSATSLGDALYYHSKCLDKETREKWTSIFMRFAEFTYNFFNLPTTNPNINYFATVCPVMAFAYKFTGDEKYKVEAYRKYEFLKEFFTDEGLLFGEGKNRSGKAKCKYVDLGYNVEESLPAIAIFGHLMNDNEVLRFAAEKFAEHIEFMLPDGGWDNSWGSRSNKWTYWGSRTSDGAQTGLCYLTHFGDIFCEAAERNFQMLEQCSRDGYLFGGPHYAENREDPCTHHSFCHAKALAIMIDTKFKYEKKAILPREQEYGIKHYDSINVSLISKGQFRATITGNDAIDYYSLAPTGGTLSALWTKRTGMLFSSSAPEYGSAVNEARNMQLSRTSDNIANCTLRIAKDGFLSQNDRNVVISVNEDESNIYITANGILKNSRFEGNIPYTLSYIFSNDSITVTAMCKGNAQLIIPVICLKSDTVANTGNKITITKPNAIVTLTATNGEFILPKGTDHRDISLIGGFMTFPISVNLLKERPFTFTLSL